VRSTEPGLASRPLKCSVNLVSLLPPHFYHPVFWEEGRVHRVGIDQHNPIRVQSGVRSTRLSGVLRLQCKRLKTHDKAALSLGKRPRFTWRFAFFPPVRSALLISRKQQHLSAKYAFFTGLEFYICTNVYWNVHLPVWSKNLKSLLLSWSSASSNQHIKFSCQITASFRKLNQKDAAASFDKVPDLVHQRFPTSCEDGRKELKNVTIFRYLTKTFLENVPIFYWLDWLISDQASTRCYPLQWASSSFPVTVKRMCCENFLLFSSLSDLFDVVLPQHCSILY